MPVTTAIELVQRLGGRLHVVTAYKPESLRISQVPAEFRDQITNPADLLVEEFRSLAKKSGLEAEFHAATGEPGDAIVRVANGIHADLIVVGNKGMKAARRVLRSVPNSIAHHAPCSVLIVDPTGVESRGVPQPREWWRTLHSTSARGCPVACFSSVVRVPVIRRSPFCTRCDHRIPRDALPQATS